jgi:hypothetical protein
MGSTTDPVGKVSTSRAPRASFFLLIMCSGQGAGNQSPTVRGLLPHEKCHFQSCVVGRLTAPASAAAGSR